MRPTDIVNEHFQVIHKEKNEFMCKYCKKVFVKHITRMSKHFVVCESIPSDIKNPVVDDIMKRADIEKKDPKNKREMSIPEKDALWESLARAVYNSSVPFSIVENKYWIQFFEMLEPSITLPTRKNLSEGLLNDEYNRVAEEVQKNIQSILSYGVQINSWSNIRYEPIVNVVVTTPEPLLYKSDYTETQHHTGEFYAETIKETILECGKDRCFAVYTDNASAMIKAWKLLQKDPGLATLPIAYYGCAAHSKNLLASDILKQPTSERIKKEITNIITTINGSQVLKEELKRIQKEIYKKVVALLLPVKTRWCYIVDSIQSFLKARISLIELAKSPKVNKYLSQDVRNLILGEEIWIEGDQLCFLLQPIKIWISSLEADSSIISKIPQAAKEIFDHLRSNLPLSPLTVDEQKNILNICERRFSEMMHPIHYASNIFDPQCQGTILSTEKKVQGYNHILKITVGLKLNQELVYKELSEYMKRVGFWKNKLLWDSTSCTKNSPRVWWTTFCSGTLLSNVAAVILAMPPTSAATERTFSLYSNVHTKKRNRLSSEHAGKVVFIKRNLQVFHGFQKNLAEKEEDEEMDSNDSITTMNEFVDVENCCCLDLDYFKEE